MPFDVDPEGSRRWAGIMKIMLRWGADPKAVILGEQWVPEDTALEVFGDIAGTYYDAEVWGVKSSLARMK